MAVEGWTRFDPQPEDRARPIAFVGPAADGTPHALAVRAAALLEQQIPTLTAGVDFAAPGAGKMFGVLVVDGGAAGIGFLRGFSGMVARRWILPGFVPPLFDVAMQAEFWPAGEAEVDAMTLRIAGLEGAARRELIAERRSRSRELWARLQQTYRIADARGCVRTNAELFAPGVAPGGAGDCAGPKLVGHAHRHGLRPLALAELWWGASSGERVHGSFHAPCVPKCGPILAHMLGA